MAFPRKVSGPSDDSRRRLETGREGITQEIQDRCTAAIEGGDHGGRVVEAGALQVRVTGIAEVAAPAPSHHELGIELVSEAEPRLDGLPVGVRGVPRLAVHAGKEKTAAHGWEAR